MTSAPVLWFTGLSGAGKSTVAARVAELLERDRVSALLLDGDEVRRIRHSDLGFGATDVMENNRRIVDLCRRHRPRYGAILVPVISPRRAARAYARACLRPGFYEIYFSAPLACVAARDPKGLYARAERGEVADMIGYAPQNPYEPPTDPDLVIESAKQPPEASASVLYEFVRCRIAQPLS